MATVKQFEELGVWQDARQLVRNVYSLSNVRAFNRDGNLRDQIRRAATSTMSYVAEGFERDSRNEFIRFLKIAKGSNGELRSQLYIALDQGYLGEADFNLLRDAAMPLSRRISSFIRYLQKCPNNTSPTRTPQKTPKTPDPA